VVYARPERLNFGAFVDEELLVVVDNEEVEAAAAFFCDEEEEEEEDDDDEEDAGGMTVRDKDRRAVTISDPRNQVMRRSPSTDIPS